jgi:tetratricopeptide (TPR) repeat protein
MPAVIMGRDNASMFQMPRRNTHTKRRGFGIYLGSLRDLKGETQEELAAKLRYSTSLVGSIENGSRKPTEHVLARLSKIYSEYAQQITDEAERYGRNALSPEEQAWDAAQQEVVASIRADDLQGLLDVIDAERSNPYVRGSSRELWLYERLSEYWSRHGNAYALSEILDDALSVAKNIDISDPDLIAMRDQLICVSIATCDLDEARRFLDSDLFHFPEAPLLWYRKGVVEWAQGNLIGALSALNSALEHKSALSPDIHCLRGVVHTELEQYADALTDFDRAFASPTKLPIEHACADSARLWVIYRLGMSSYEDTIARLTRLERTMPDNAWIYYYRGKCHIHAGDRHAGLAEWDQYALSYTKPGVCRWVAENMKNALQGDAMFGSHHLWHSLTDSTREIVQRFTESQKDGNFTGNGVNEKSSTRTPGAIR